MDAMVKTQSYHLGGGRVQRRPPQSEGPRCVQYDSGSSMGSVQSPSYDMGLAGDAEVLRGHQTSVSLATTAATVGPAVIEQDHPSASAEPSPAVIEQDQTHAPARFAAGATRRSATAAAPFASGGQTTPRSAGFAAALQHISALERVAAASTASRFYGPSRSQLPEGQEGRHRSRLGGGTFREQQEFHDDRREEKQMRAPLESADAPLASVRFAGASAAASRSRHTFHQPANNAALAGGSGDDYPPAPAAFAAAAKARAAAANAAHRQQQVAARARALEDLQVQAAEAEVAAAEARRDFLLLLARTQQGREQCQQEGGGHSPASKAATCLPGAAAAAAPFASSSSWAGELAQRQETECHSYSSAQTDVAEKMRVSFNDRAAASHHRTLQGLGVPGVASFGETYPSFAAAAAASAAARSLHSQPQPSSQASLLQRQHGIRSSSCHPTSLSTRLEAAQEILGIAGHSGAGSYTPGKRGYADAVSADVDCKMPATSRASHSIFSSGRGPAKKRRYSFAASDEDDGDDEASTANSIITAPSPAPPLMMPQPGQLQVQVRPPHQRPGSSGGGGGDPDDAPRRPLSAYNCFFSDERERILRAMDDPSLSGSDIGSDGMPDIAVLDAVLTRQWNIEHPPSQTTDDWEEEMRRKLVLQRTSKKRPKRLHRKSHGKIGFHALTKLVGMRWKALGPERREYYDRMAKLDMKRYRQDIARFNEEQRRRGLPRVGKW